MGEFLTRKVLGFLSGGLALALALAVAFGWLQTDRLSTARDTIAANAKLVSSYEDRIRSDAGLIKTRDTLIATQNAAVQAIRTAQQGEREAYLGRIAQASSVAKTFQSQAADIMARSEESTDELVRSRAALKLIKDTLANDRASPPQGAD